MTSFAIRHYLTPAGRDPFSEWVYGLRDRRAAGAVVVRVARLERGLFGDCRPVGEGIYELRIDVGPGYRVYFGRIGRRVILLLCGGDKGRQHEDIEQAKTYWADYWRRTGAY